MGMTEDNIARGNLT